MLWVCSPNLPDTRDESDYWCREVVRVLVCVVRVCEGMKEGGGGRGRKGGGRWEEGREVGRWEEVGKRTGDAKGGVNE